MNNSLAIFTIATFLCSFTGCTINLGRLEHTREPHPIANQPWCSPGNRAKAYVVNESGSVSSRSWVEWQCDSSVLNSRNAVETVTQSLKEQNQWSSLVYYSGTYVPGIDNDSDIVYIDAILLIVCIDPIVVFKIEGKTPYIRGIGYSKNYPDDGLADNLLSNGFTFGTSFSTSSDRIGWFTASSNQIQELPIGSEFESHVKLDSKILTVSYKGELGLYSVELKNP